MDTAPGKTCALDSALDSTTVVFMLNLGGAHRSRDYALLRNTSICRGC
jgi:hypothetical protein